MSSEQIAGAIQTTYSDLHTKYESIYLYIYNYAPYLTQYLHKRHRKRKKRGLAKQLRAPAIPNRVHISERGDISHEYGHWEFDRVGTSSKATVATLLEKKLV